MGKKRMALFILLASAAISLCACGNRGQSGENDRLWAGQKASVEKTAQGNVNDGKAESEKDMDGNQFTVETTVSDVINDAAFEGFGRLLFPVDRDVAKDMTLQEVSSSDVYVWYSEIHPENSGNTQLPERAVFGGQADISSDLF